MKKERNFISKDIKINSWEDIKSYFDDLLKRNLKSTEGLIKWWKDRSEVFSFLEEDMAWRYIKMSCDTADKKLTDDFNFFVKEIEPKVSEYSDELDRKLINCPFTEELDNDKYFVPLRAIKRDIEIFRKENIPILSNLQQKEQEYGAVTSAMTVTYKGEEMTLPKSSNLLKNTDRKVRKEIYELINNRRLKDSGKLNDLFTELLSERQQIAHNADYNNYRDYKFASLKRFDYTTPDCFNFHISVRECVLPIIEELHEKRRQKFSYKSLRPYDLEVDFDQKSLIVPFKDTNELIEKSILVFSKVRPKYGEFLKTMKENGFMDLDSRKGKAPGGFNYPLYESNVPFIFTNATGNLRDVETMMHEGGHAVHSFLSSELELVDFKSLPSEVAELASMSMELISMEYWDIFYDNEDDLKRAKRHQLEGVLKVLPWIAIVDKFQHLIYTLPDRTVEERTEIWTNTVKEFSSSIVDWNGYEKFRDNSWQKQLHIFEVPFYYIEYGIAQLGAIAVWQNYKKNPDKALDQYENALKLGYTKPIPEIYETAGIKFDFGKEYIGELMEFVRAELNKI